MFPEADESLAWTLPPDDRAASEQEEEDIEEEEELDQDKEEEEIHPSAPIEFDRSVQEREDAWLAGVQHSPDRPAVCFKFANYGRCDRLETVTVSTRMTPKISRSSRLHRLSASRESETSPRIYPSRDRNRGSNRDTTRPIWICLHGSRLQGRARS